MSFSIDTIVIWLFVIFIISLIGNSFIFKALEKKGKDIEKAKKLTLNIISSSFLAIALTLTSYSLTRNNIDLLKVLSIYILFACIFYSLYKLYKNGQKTLVKFVMVPLTLLMSIFSLKLLSHLLINTNFLFTFVISICIITVIHWLFYKVGEEESDKKMTFNILYLAGIILFAVFSWHYLGEGISLKKPICEIKVSNYLKDMGYAPTEYSAYHGNDLQRGAHEFVQVHFKEDPCTYVYEYFYDEDIVKQVKIFTPQNTIPSHKDGGTEIVE